MTKTSTPSFPCEDWSKYALCYDSLRQLKPYMSMLHEVASVIGSLDTRLILDASCGTGNLGTVLAETLSQDYKLLGVDASHEMLTRAQAKSKDYDNHSFAMVDLNNPLPFESKFSQIVSLNTLYAVNSPESTLQEFYRVLSPGGYMHIVTPKSDFENGLILKEHCGSGLPDKHWSNAHASSAREEELIREAIGDEKLICDMLTVAEYNRSIAGSSHFHFFTENELTKLLEGIGFTVITSSYTYAKQDIFITVKKGN